MSRQVPSAVDRQPRTSPSADRLGLPNDRVLRAETETEATIGPLDPKATTYVRRELKTYAEIMTGPLGVAHLDPASVTAADIAAHWARCPPRLMQATASLDMVLRCADAGLSALDPPRPATGVRDVAGAVDALRALVGTCVPLFGRVNKRVDRGGGTRFGNYNPGANEHFREPSADTAHGTCFQPTVLSLYSDAARDQGRVLALVVPVTRQAFNYPHDDARRLRGPAHAAFMDAVTLALVVHVYDDAFDWNAWAPGASTADPFGWTLFKTHNPGVPIRGFGLHKQIQGVSRALLGPEKCGMTIADARSVMDARAPTLAASLACTPLNLTRAVCTEREPGRGGRRRRGDTRPTAGEVRRDARKANPSGLDIRTCMLVERLLAPTPLRALWTGDGACVPPARVFSRASLSFFSREPSP